MTALQFLTHALSALIVDSRYTVDIAVLASVNKQLFLLTRFSDEIQEFVFVQTDLVTTTSFSKIENRTLSKELTKNSKKRTSATTLNFLSDKIPQTI